jgi:cellulose synthase/poly-beta-1,6-N-acetylglucosamine synthase-like glycosyltransferase
VYLILVIKLITIQQIDNGILFATYSIAVSFYILSRFGLAYFHEPSVSDSGVIYEPTISFAVPSKNEGENIRETILRIAAVHYPKTKFNIIAINDGSDDNTLDEMLVAKDLVEQGGGISRSNRLENK